MKKSRILSQNVRNALIALSYVSVAFTRSEYEVYVRATHLFLDHTPGSVLTDYEIFAFDALSRLVSSFPTFSSCVNTKFYVL